MDGFLRVDHSTVSTLNLVRQTEVPEAWTGDPVRRRACDGAEGREGPVETLLGTDQRG